jgi:hypothetical protein
MDEDAVNEGQEFAIGGYTVGGRTLDALAFGCNNGSRLIYVARTRNGFTPQLRQSLLRRFQGVETTVCPSANLPVARGGRWGEGLTAAKMKDCNVECRTMPHRVLPVLLLLRSASFCFGIIRLSARQRHRARLLTSLNAMRLIGRNRPMRILR